MATFILCFASASIGACLGVVMARGARADRHDDAVASPSLQEALDNCERLHADMQEALRKRLGN